MTDSESTEGGYAQLPYDSNPYFESHPGRMATIGFLLGLSPPPIETCRILELGCASGGNILPIAEALPQASLVGIDLASNQIAVGQHVIDALQLKNIELHAMSLVDLPADIGEFDYIIAHGLFSWVPPDVQTRILHLCKTQLSPRGIAYISYNTLPGWRLRGVMRDLLKFAQSNLPMQTPLRTQLAEGRDLAESILNAAGSEDSDYHRVLASEVEMMLKCPDSYTAHEYLEPWHAPLYFRDFADQLKHAGLTYLADARLGKNIASIESRLLQHRPELAANRIALEQCIDFAIGRQFRRSLIVRADQSATPLFEPARLMSCHFTAGVFPTHNEDASSDAEAIFHSHGGGSFTATDPAVKISLATAAEAYPQAVSFDQIWEALKKKSRPPAGMDDTATRSKLAAAISLLYAADVIEPHITPPIFTTKISPKPVASPLARWQAKERRVVHNRRHRSVRSLTDSDCSVLEKLDGTSSIRELENSTGGTDYAVHESIRKLAENAVLIG